MKPLLIGLGVLSLIAVIWWVASDPAKPPVIPHVPHLPHMRENVARIEILDFYATWCIPCRVQKPIIDTMIAKGHKVRKIDIDKQPKLKEKYEVTSVPTYIVLRKGEEVYRTQSAADVKRYVEEKKWTDPDNRNDRRNNRRNNRRRANPDREKSINHDLQATPLL